MTIPTAHQPRPGTARQRILAAAQHLFYRQGIRATGVDQLLAEADVARMSFYRYFPTKHALVLAFLHERHAAWQGKLEAEIAGRNGNPATQVTTLFEVLTDWFAEPDFRGCAFINTTLETTDPQSEERKVARWHKDQLLSYLTHLAAAAGAGEPANTAMQLLLLVDGAIVRAQMGDGPRAALTAQALAALLFS